MPFLPALRTQVAAAAQTAEVKSDVPIAFAQYYAALSTYNLHRRARDWPIERAVVEGYERAIWVFKSVQSIAADSARLPYQLRQGEDVVDDHPLYKVLNVKANPLESGQVFRKRLSGQLLLSKRGAFVEVTKSNGGTVNRLDLLPPDRTEIVPGRGADLVDHVRLTRRDGSYKNLDWDKVLWFRDPNLLDPYMGVTPVEPAGLSIELDYFARLYNVAFMQNDGRPGGVLAVRDTKGGTGDLGEPEMDRIEKRFGKNAGPHEAGKLSVIAGDLSYVDLAARPRDMAYGETSKNAKVEVLSAFGTPESVLGYAADRTFDNADAELYTYWTRTVANHNSILLDGFEEHSDDDMTGFFDTSDVEVLERADRLRREEARSEVAAGVRSLYSYFVLAGRTDEIDDMPQTRALYLPTGLTPLPSREKDMEALGLGQPTDPNAPPPVPGGDPAALPAAGGDAGNAPGAGSDAANTPGGPPALPAAPSTGTNPAPAGPAGPARAALEALATGKSARVEFRLQRKDPAQNSPDDETEPDLAAADALEAALALAFHACSARWVERAAVRVESPKQRKGTRHFEPEYAEDTRVGNKALDAAKAVDEQTWQAEAEDAAHPIVEEAAIAAAVLLATDLALRPPPGITLTEWARRAVQRTVLEVVDFVGRSAVTQAAALIRAINIADQQGEPLTGILTLVRDKTARMNAWADGLATQVATATSNGARDAMASESNDGPVDRVWFSRRDDHVRPTHAPVTGADGQVRALSEPFIVGTALLMRPGDPNGPLRETAGCRCYLRHRLQRSGRWAPTPGKALALDPARAPYRIDRSGLPRDGDSDGFIYDGTARQAPAVPHVPTPPNLPHVPTSVPAMAPYAGEPNTPDLTPALGSIGMGSLSAKIPLKNRGRPDGAGTVDDPIDVQGDFDAAVTHLADGKHIRLNRVDEVGTLLDKMAEMVTEARSKGAKAPTYDLCKVSVPGTNLFCHDSKGVPRAQMPQLSGWPVPGSLADTLPKNARGRVNGLTAFRAMLEARGVSVQDRTVKASWLKATQNQLNGAKVAEIAEAMAAGVYPDAAIFVTRDGYVIDGHHRWAAKVGLDARDNRLGDVTMPVQVIDMEVGEALDFANAFSKDLGIQQEAFGVGDRPTDLPDPQVRNPDFGKVLGDPLLIPSTGGGFVVMETVGGRKPGQRVQRVKYRVERHDGVWGVYPPTSASPAVFSTGNKRQAIQRALDFASGKIDPSSDEASEADAPAHR